MSEVVFIALVSQGYIFNKKRLPSKEMHLQQLGHDNKFPFRSCEGAQLSP